MNHRSDEPGAGPAGGWVGELPPGADRPPTGLSRRGFLELLGASAALASLVGCGPPDELIVPYARKPPEATPGVPLTYATSMVLDGYATGLLVRSREGRPIKVEGNPDHPASLGAAGPFEQASVLGLYDPTRGQGARWRERPVDWRQLREAFGGPRGDRGERLRFLLEPTASPLRRRLIDQVRERHPRARFTFHSATYDPAPFEAAREVFGRPLAPRFHFDRADVVVIVGADPAASGPFHLRYARQLVARRRPTSLDEAMSRVWVAEDSPTPTGVLADEHLALRRSDMVPLLAALARAAAGNGAGRPGEEIPLPEEARAWVETAAGDLRRARGRGVVVAGEGLPPAAHAQAYLLNERLGNAGITVTYGEPALLEAGEPSHDLAGLAAELRAGQVETLVVLEGNPAFTAPADLGLAGLLPGVARSLYLGQHEDETALLTAGYVAAAHYLESWGDAGAWDGTASPVQPLIRPLYGGRTADEVLALFAGRGEASAHELVRAAWRAAVPGPVAAFESFWNRSLQRGLFPDTASPDVTATPAAGAVERFGAGRPAAAAGAAGLTDRAASGPRPLELVFRPDRKVHDGRFAGNAWLQEMPDPVTRITWDNAALLSAATCDRLGIERGQVVELALGERRLRAPVFPLPGHADDTVTVHLGYGRRTGAGVGQGVGFDAYRLRTGRQAWLASGLEVRPLFAPARRIDGAPREEHGEALRHDLVSTQDHWSLEGREVALHDTLEELRRHPEKAERHRGPVATLYQAPPMDAPHQWAMTIDLAACTGCSACVVACQAENNVPVVGKEGVAHGREMHWLRIDNYLAGTPGHLGRVQQPMLCQQCEKAPCEYVCPVNATVHSDDGLNQMVYNRCVGTRFCSNNCPYKVRRFNWFDFNQARSDTECLVLNPDVTVRERGVMEKCTYCVQRIRRAENRADVEGRELATDEVATACQQACPTGAIVFGSITDPASRVAKSRENPRMYEELHDLGTQPRTRYLVKVSNPSPELERWRREHRPGREGAGAGGRGRVSTGSGGAAVGTHGEEAGE